MEIHSQQVQPCVYDILVAIFQIIENQSKFASFRTVIDAYLSKNFCITLAHKPLLRIFHSLMSSISDRYSLVSPTSGCVRTTNFPKLTAVNLNKSPQNQTPGRTSMNSNGNTSLESGYMFDANTNAADVFDTENALNNIKSMEYIFKFAFRSRELLSQCVKYVKDDTFDSDVEQIFQTLTQIATLNVNNSSQSADLIKIQSFILKYSITLMPILIESKRYSIQKIGQLYIGFLSSRFVMQTQFLSKLIKSKLFEVAESRNVLMEPMCRTIRSLLRVESCDFDTKTFVEESHESVVKLISELMDVLERKNIGNIHSNINEISKYQKSKL